MILIIKYSVSYLWGIVTANGVMFYDDDYCSSKGEYCLGRKGSE